MARLHREGRSSEEGRYEPALAAALSADPRIDVHELLELVDRGCPPHLALRILAPLDDAVVTQRKETQ